MSNQDLTKDNQGSNQGDLISRKELRKDIEHLHSVYAKNKEWFYTDVLDHIDNAPTVDTDLSGYSDKLWKEAYERGKNERPQGEWIEHQDCYDDTYYTCSHCGEDWITIEGKPTDNLMNYCPMCGAEMREADNE